MKVFSGHIVDILNRRIFDGRIQSEDGVIVSVDECEMAEDDLPYILPGFVDSHVHIESSMLTPVEYAKLAVTGGTVGVVTDPHEIANVIGIQGVEFMIDNASRTSFNFCFGAPSCVPSCGGGIETPGAVLTSKDVEILLRKPQIAYLSEMMNCPGVLSEDPEVMAKIAAAHNLGKPVDGHAPGISPKDRARYAAAGITTDHECITYEEGLACIQNGMYVLVREGSAAKNFEALIPLMAEYPEKLMFCTDDMHPGMSDNSPILSMVRRSLAKGYDLWDVLRAASLNPQVHYALNWGLLRVGDPATFILADSLCESMDILATYIREEPLKTDENISYAYPNCFKAKQLSIKDIASQKEEGDVPVIVATDGSLYTFGEYARRDDRSYPWQEVQKIVVVNRYDSDARPAVGYIRGFNISDGAMAASIAHDCHNIVAIGSSDKNIVRVVNEVIRMNGGIAAVAGENRSASLELPIAGLVSPLSYEAVSAKNDEILSVIASAGCTMQSPLVTMSFMCLPVIPQLKITDKGIFDSVSFSFKSVDAPEKCALAVGGVYEKGEIKGRNRLQAADDMGFKC